MDISFFDIISLLIIALSSIFGIYCGLIKSAIGLATFIFSLLGSYVIYPFVNVFLVHFFSENIIVLIISIVISYIIVLLVFSVINAKLCKIAECISGGLIDRILGGILGIIRGIIIDLLIFLLIIISVYSINNVPKTLYDTIALVSLNDKHPKWIQDTYTQKYSSMIIQYSLKMFSNESLKSIKLYGINNDVDNNDSITNHIEKELEDIIK